MANGLFEKNNHASSLFNYYAESSDSSDDVFVSIDRISPFFPPRSPSLQMFFQNLTCKGKGNAEGELSVIENAQVSSYAHYQEQSCSESADLRGNCIRISAIGDADLPKIVFVHGFPDSPHIWQRQIDAFKEEYCIVFIHLPFCTTDPIDCRYNMPIMGFTIQEMASDCNDVLIRILEENEKVNIVGHGWGAKLSGEMIAQEPGIFKTRTILNDAPQQAKSRSRNVLISLLRGIAYEYAVVLVYFIARLIWIDLAVLVFLLSHLWPPILIIHMEFIFEGPINEKFNPMSGFILLQEQLARFYPRHAPIENIIPSIPTVYFYGHKFFVDEAFISEMKKKEYKCEQFSSFHYFHYTNAKEFNEKLHDFLRKHTS